MKYTDKEIKEILNNINVLVDTREQKWNHIETEFKNINCSYIKKKLNFGDYSFELQSDLLNKPLSFENQIVIERKNSLDELAICFTTGRERFENEFKRINHNKSKCILLIEDDNLANLRNHTYRSKILPKSFEASLWSWKHRYNYEVFFCSKNNTGLYIYNLFYYYLKEQLKGGVIN